MKVRRKPIIYDAEQWFPGIEIDGVTEVAIQSHVAMGLVNEEKTFHVSEPVVRGRVETLEGPVYACPGDFIITGTRGEKWPVKPDIFHASYEIVSD